MGRMKALFCAFCLERTSVQTSDDTIDVSHLATPHLSSDASDPLNDIASNDAAQKITSDINNNKYPHPGANKHLVSGRIPSRTSTPDGNQSPKSTDASKSPTPCQQPNRPQLSVPSPSSSLNLYEAEPQPSLQELHQDSPRINQNAIIPLNQPPIDHHSGSGSPKSYNKLSYDIISVREPLAKMLAERQHLQSAFQQQRQLLGDHDYIEVYGERGSSCFYEEIAGSTTSSATYDQIGAPSSHNYQALINAYAVITKPSRNLNVSSMNRAAHETNQVNDEDSYEGSDQMDTPGTSSDSKPTLPLTNHRNLSASQSHDTEDNDDSRSKSIPVYSVINKATRRSNAIIRASIDNNRPPQPPPKNLSRVNLPSVSAINHYHDKNTHIGKHNLLENGQGTSYSYQSTNVYNEHRSNLPQPPPRLSKHPIFRAVNRPLPLPEAISINTNNDKSHYEIEEDKDSISNGYELLITNFDDDQIDVGYEKIRESNRYSGGSISSQIRSLRLLDNDGYESVQPIYSSPSNALAEPNYEAIGPATASELAAAATARLTAAATVIEILEKD